MNSVILTGTLVLVIHSLLFCQIVMLKHYKHWCGVRLGQYLFTFAPKGVKLLTVGTDRDSVLRYGCPLVTMALH